MSSRRDIRKPMLAVVALLALALAASSSAPAGASPPPAPTGATQTSSAGTQPPATTAPVTQPASAPPSQASIKDMDVCALISETEVESTVAFDVNAGKKLKEQTETAGCQWDAKSSHGIQFVTISVFAFSEDAWFPPDAGEPDGEMVKGVGDDAYRKEIGLSGTAGDLVVRKGGLIINITVFNDQRKIQGAAPSTGDAREPAYQPTVGPLHPDRPGGSGHGRPGIVSP